MKQLVLPPIKLVDRRDLATLEGALHAVFGPRMLRKVHGASLRDAGPFDAEGRRAFRFAVQVGSVPRLIRRFFCGSELTVSARQTLDRADAAKWVVTNNLKMHFVGAQLFRLRPTFWLQRGEDGVVTLGGLVRHDAVLPPPLKGVAEGFMARNTQRELLHFASCLHEEGVIADLPRP